MSERPAAAAAPHVSDVSYVSWGSLAVIVGTVLGVIPATFGLLSHDVAWYLYGSRRMMEGAKLYVDIFDVNPPLVFFLGAPVEWFAMRTGIQELYVMIVAVALATLLGAAVAASAFRASASGIDGVARAVIGGWLASVLLLPGYDFAQREHWVLLLLFPYCVTTLVAAEGTARLPRWTALIAGVMGGLACAMKPHFFGVPLIFWAVIALRRRSLRPLLSLEHLAVVATMAAYALAVVLVTPEYLWGIVPIASQQYWAFEVPRRSLLGVQDVQLLIGAAAIMAIGGVALTGSRRGGTIAQLLALLSLAFMATFLVQAKGWWYQLLPAKVFCVAAAIVTTVAFVHQAGKMRHAAGPRSRVVVAARALGVGLVMVPMTMFLALAVDAQGFVIKEKLKGDPTPLLDLVRARAAGRPMYMLSTSVPPAWPLVNIAGASWPYHFPHLWALPGFYRSDDVETPIYRTPDQQSPNERWMFRTVVEDLTRTPPALLLVDVGRYKQAFGVRKFDYIHYFSQDPAFRELFAQYRPIMRMGPLDIYEHVPPASAAAAPMRTPGN